MPGSDLLLPQRAVLLHIGPHKTGTTAIQGALLQARSALAEHGVVYAGRERQHMMAALAVTGGKGLYGDPQASMPHWNRLVEQVAAAEDRRVVVSSEFFDDADPATARRIVEELGGQRVHVVVTLRPLAKILPSAWQQYVRNKLRLSYQDWLDAMLNKPPYVEPTTTFWQRHRHDVLVDRWATIVGPQNLTVVVVDESDRLELMRTFERLLGVPPGLLAPEHGMTNRSLTLGEIELVRQLNIEFKRQGWSDDLYRDVVREGLVAHLQATRSPGPDEPQITTPTWALERAAAIGAAAAERIVALGVRVVGDISILGAIPETAVGSAEVAPMEPVLPVNAASDAVVGTIMASYFLGPEPSTLLGRRLNTIRSAELATVVLRRLPRRLRRRLRRPSANS